MTTAKQKTANRKNALRSTGPKTEEGKQTSSHNAVKHGIFSEEIVITKGEVQEKEIEFTQLADELHRDLKPEGQMETLLVEKIVVNYWRLRRLLRYETGEVRQLLDKHIREYMESPYGIESAFSSIQQSPPICLYFSLQDQFTDEQFKMIQARIDALENDRIDYTADSDIIHYVLVNRIRRSDEQSPVENREQAIVYLRNLSPQQKGKIKQAIVGTIKRQKKEMQEIVKWQKQLEIIKLIRSIPVESDLNKVIKYESSLERSIFKNLDMLKTLQRDRRNSQSRD